jgi:carbon storage regulator
MLVLSRREREDIIVTTADGTRVRIAVIEIRHDRVRLGFEAPDDTTINRLELQERIDAGEPTRGGRA